MPQTSQSAPPLAPPRIDGVVPACALPSATVELTGAHLGPFDDQQPLVLVDDKAARVLMCRPEHLAMQVPADARTGLVEVRNVAGASNHAPLRVARELSDGLHPVTSPVVSASGMIFATISGARGKQTPVSIVRISPDGRGTPFVTEILNATGLAFNPDGELFVTSRAEGIVYSVDAAGQTATYVEGMGIATGAAFDKDGNLFVGDRSGTIFRIDPKRQTFVHATLEPSISAYHLAINADNELLVTGPSLSSNDAVWIINRDGEARPYYRGLGRPQGMALDSDNNLYVAACLHGQHGIVRINTAFESELVVAGLNLVGIAFSPLGTAVLATHQAIYDIDLGVEGLRIF